MAAPAGSGPPLRVAQVCPYSLSRPGGVQGQATGLARALVARGHAVSVFAPLDDPRDAPDGVDLVACGHSVALPANGSVAPVSWSVPALRRALHALRAGAYDVVHLHEPFAPGLSYGLLASSRRPPMVATFHRSGGSALYSIARPLTARIADRLAVRCAVSEAAATTARTALGGSYEILFNGVEVERYRTADPWPTDRAAVLFLGRHEHRKGLDVLLEAFERLVADRRSELGDAADLPELWIAGDGPETARLRGAHPDSPEVHWLGVLDEASKARRLAGATVVCAPSRSGESFGIVLLEGMAASTVVVASDLEGYRAASGGHAVLVPAGDPVRLAETLTGVLEGRLARSERAPTGPDERDDGRARWLAAAARRADAWSIDVLAARYEECYRTVLAKERA